MIYILSIYGEYGAERVKATTDKSEVVNMLRSYSSEKIFPNMKGPMGERTFDITDKEIESLEQKLDELELSDGTDLMKVWGGFQLHIVEEYSSDPDWQKVGSNVEVPYYKGDDHLSGTRWTKAEMEKFKERQHYIDAQLNRIHMTVPAIIGDE